MKQKKKEKVMEMIAIILYLAAFQILTDRFYFLLYDKTWATWELILNYLREGSLVISLK